MDVDVTDFSHTNGSGTTGVSSGQETVIRADRPWYDLGLHELWRYRSLLWTITWRDIRVRYKQSVLGLSWVIFKPVMTLVVFSVVFGGIANLDSQGVPYPIFLYSGMIIWNLFRSVTLAISNCVVTNMSVIRRVYLPSLILPLSSMGARAIDFLASILVLLGLVVYYEQTDLQWCMLALIPFGLLALIAALGFGLLFAPLTAAYRDFVYFSSYFLQTMMYVTPVVYSVRAVPEGWRWLMMLNPMAGIVDAHRAVVLGQPIDWQSLWVSAASGVVIAAVGFIYYRQIDRRFADIA
jgi:lipopolysaccharide transport system permease protein